ncbi:hypothetical protein COB18_01680 [Candidatus Kaiserbacteria bacterium]|nr:MAG: hypothetical protein COB18_01680 [Candidatus Kaiserbacteria bacterium]
MEQAEFLTGILVTGTYGVLSALILSILGFMCTYNFGMKGLTKIMAQSAIFFGITQFVLTSVWMILVIYTQRLV